MEGFHVAQEKQALLSGQKCHIGLFKIQQKRGSCAKSRGFLIAFLTERLSLPEIFRKWRNLSRGLIINFPVFKYNWVWLSHIIFHFKKRRPFLESYCCNQICIAWHSSKFHVTRACLKKGSYFFDNYPHTLLELEPNFCSSRLHASFNIFWAQ